MTPSYISIADEQCRASEAVNRARAEFLAYLTRLRTAHEARQDAS